MDIDKALKAAGINRSNVSKVARPLERVPSDEPAPSPQIEGGRQSDMDKPVKSFEVGRRNEENVAEDLDLMSNDESQLGDEIEEGGEMDMDKPLKSYPAITDEIRAKILRLNLARLAKIDLRKRVKAA